MSIRFIDSYVHQNRIGVLVELETSDDFVTRTEEFKSLARDLAMQIAAMGAASAKDGGSDQASSELIGREEHESALMSQAFIRDTSTSVADRFMEAESALGARIRLIRFARFEAVTE